MTTLHALTYVGNAVLVALFLLSVGNVGSLVLRVLRRGGAGSSSERFVMGLAAYYLLGIVLGALGAFAWPVLTAAAAVPGMLAVPRVVRRIVPKVPGCLRLALSEYRENLPLSILLTLVGLLYVVISAVPVVHYDLLVNYLGIPLEYLRNRSTEPVPYNIHSSLSLFLHVIFAYLLSLNRLCNDTVFMFGSGTAYCIFNFAMQALVCLRCGELIRGLTDSPEDGLPAAMAAALLWLTFPQTLLMASLDYPDFFTTTLVLSLFSLLLGLHRGKPSDALVPGVLAGILLGAKSQMAIVVALALGYVAVRVRLSRGLFYFLAGLLLFGSFPLLRNHLAYGNALFPFASDGSAHAAAASLLLKENAYAPTLSPMGWVANVWRFFTLQPETGFSSAFLLFILARRGKNLTVLALALIPIAVINVASGSSYHTLRWVQYSLVILFGVAAVNYQALARRHRYLRVVALLFIAASLYAGLTFVTSVVNIHDYYRASEDDYMSQYIPSYGVRRGLTELPARVLYMGELFGYYGAEKGIFPTVHDSAYLQRYLDAKSSGEIRGRLGRDGVAYISVCHAYDEKLSRGGYLSWVGTEQARVIREFLAGLRVVARTTYTTVYAVDDTSAGANQGS